MFHNFRKIVQTFDIARIFIESSIGSWLGAVSRDQCAGVRWNWRKPTARHDREKGPFRRKGPEIDRRLARNIPKSTKQWIIRESGWLKSIRSSQEPQTLRVFFLPARLQSPPGYLSVCLRCQSNQCLRGRVNLLKYKCVYTSEVIDKGLYI